MAAPKGNIVPTGTAVAAGRATRHRIRALLDEALAGVAGPGATVRHSSGASMIERIQLALLEAPVATLAAIEKLLPVDPDEAKTGAPGSLNIGALYLQAVQQAQPAPLVIEHDPGYIAGTGSGKPLITLNDW